MTKTNFIDTADARETSPEIMSAILWVARGCDAERIWFALGEDETEAERIWADPSDAELLAIWERVTKNGLINASEFCWGASGSDWANNV